MSEKHTMREVYRVEGEYNHSPWAESRIRIAAELRQIVENGLPEIENDWNIIPPLSGPETGNIFDEENRENRAYNETEKRFRTALDVAKAVTAKRLSKKEEEVTLEDIRDNGPIVYFNGLAAQNEFLKTEYALSILEQKYGFPREKLQLTSNTEIKHTGHQFLDFNEHVPEEGKMILVSDLYHLPRMRRYLGLESNKLTEENTVLYAATPIALNVALTLDEIRKIYGYIQKGILPAEDFDPYYT